MVSFEVGRTMARQFILIVRESINKQFTLGYNLYITRSKDRHEAGRSPIAPEEWLAVVAQDPELTIDDPTKPYFATWAGKCSYPNGTWFDLQSGSVYTKSPDRAILAKMLSVAERLNAHVVGDDDEVYLSTDGPIVEPEDSSPAPEKPWWRFW